MRGKNSTGKDDERKTEENSGQSEKRANEYREEGRQKSPCFTQRQLDVKNTDERIVWRTRRSEKRTTNTKQNQNYTHRIWKSSLADSKHAVRDAA